MSNRLMAATSVVARMMVGVGTLILLAFSWAPADFGFFATAFSIGTLLALFTNYGFVMQTLREIGANPGIAGRLMSISLALKSILAVIFIAISLACMIFSMEWSAYQMVTFFTILLATSIASFGDLALNAFRGLGAFGSEVKIVTATSVIHIAAIALGVVLSLDLLAMSVLLLGSRLLYTAVCLRYLDNLVQFRSTGRFCWAEAKHWVKKSTPFAIDAGLVNVATQLDGVIVAHLLGLNAAGIFQAGYRLAQGVIPFGAVLASVHIPVFASKLKQGDVGAIVYGRRLLCEYFILGFIFAIAIIFLGPVYSSVMLDTAYSEIDSLWLGLGVFTFLRFVASGLGAHLIVSCDSYLRPACVLFSLIVSVSSYFVFLPTYGLKSAPWIAAVGAGSLIFFYLVLMRFGPRSALHSRN